MKELNHSERLSWRLKPLADATGLSVPFLRKEIRAGRLPARKIGAAVVVLAEHARAFLVGQIETHQKQKPDLFAKKQTRPNRKNFGER